ncbi:MAG TPA: hypothetical protein VFX67_06315 [Burkholderiales bacterium]|jgi:hypothetical protein|nr:hypothetical protein [Burkholderiales bacterium]
MEARKHGSPAGPTRFTVGKYEVVGQPLPGSMHMLRYIVSVAGKRIGVMMSVPTESDCRYLEKPPPVPPLKPFQAHYRPGRPKKNAAPPAPALASEPRRGGLSAADMPAAVPFAQAQGIEDR